MVPDTIGTYAWIFVHKPDDNACHEMLFLLKLKNLIADQQKIPDMSCV